MDHPVATLSLYSNGDVRTQIGKFLAGTAKVAFGFCLISFPLRYRITIEARPIPPIYQDYTDILLFLPDIFLVITLVTWLLSLIGLKKSPHFKPSALTALLLGLLAIILASSIFSRNPSYSTYYLVRSVGLFGLYLFLINEIRDLKIIAIPLAIMIVGQSLIGLGQAWQQASIGLGFLGELDLDPALSGVSIISTGVNRTLRAYGLSDHPNILGGGLALGVTLFFGWTLSKSKGYKMDNKGAILLILASAVLGVGILTLFLTYSRSAWLAFISAIILAGLMLWVTRQFVTLQTLAATLAAALILLAPFVLTNINYLGVRVNFQNSFEEIFNERQSLTERAALNQAGNQIFAENAIIGVGPGIFPQALQEHAPEFPYNYQPPHLILLEAAAETGIFGGLLLASLMILPWISLWINRHYLTFNSTLIFTSAGLLGVTIIGLFDYYPWLLAPGRYWFWTIWGLWGAAYLASYEESFHD